MLHEDHQRNHSTKINKHKGGEQREGVRTRVEAEGVGRERSWPAARSGYELEGLAKKKAGRKKERDGGVRSARFQEKNGRYTVDDQSGRKEKKLGQIP